MQFELIDIVLSLGVVQGFFLAVALTRIKKIYKIALAGDVTEFAGSGVDRSVNGELKNASFSGPNGIVVDKNRRVLYISEAVNGGGANLRVIPLD